MVSLQELVQIGTSLPHLVIYSDKCEKKKTEKEVNCNKFILVYLPAFRDT